MANTNQIPDNERQRRIGMAFGVGAYLWWGFAPIYFKAVAHIPAIEVLGHRIVWSVVLLFLLLVFSRRLRAAIEIARTRRMLLILCASTLLLATNWFIFIHAVATERVMEASLGYFINPLVNIALGAMFLNERLTPREKTSVVLAASGVAYLALLGGSIPWLALILAFSFGFYGLLRKIAQVDAVVGLSVEVGLLVPVALGYLVFAGDSEFFGWESGVSSALLMLGGVITAVPLLCFGMAARRLRLTTIGFLQYIAPSLQLLLAVALYGEELTTDRMICFALIWSALAMFALDSLSVVRQISVGRDAGNR